MAVAPGWMSNADAVRSFTDDVLAVAAELVQAADAAGLAASLRELVELASAGRLLVADDEDALLVTNRAGAFRLSVELLAPE